MVENDILDVVVSTGTPSVDRADFGKVLALCSGLGAGFTERVRTYTSLSQMTADSDLTAGARNIGTAFFAQSPSPDALLIGNRSDADAAQVNTVEPNTAADGDYTVTINGEAFTHAASGETEADITAALIIAINAGDEPVTAAAGTGDAFTVTSDSAGLGFTISVTSNLDNTDTTANVGASTNLASCLAETQNFYGIVLESRDDNDIKDVAAYLEGYTDSPKIFLGQSNSADIITSAETDVASFLKSKSYTRSGALYHSDNSEMYDIAELSKFLGADFDINTPQADKLTLSGIAVDDTLTATAISNMNDKNVGYYTTFKGLSISYNVKNAVGNDLELKVTGDWYTERIEEAVANLLVGEANKGKRVQYNDKGFSQVGGVIEAVLLDGESIGHANSGSSEISIPERSSMSESNIAAGLLPIEFGATYSGKVKKVQVRGYVSVDFNGL